MMTAARNLKRGDRVICPDGTVRTVALVVEGSRPYPTATVTFVGTMYALNVTPAKPFEVVDA